MIRIHWVLIPFLFTACADSTVKTDPCIPIKPGWTLLKPLYGGISGTTSVEVVFPKAGTNLPVTFGIPLGQVRSADTVVMMDGNGDEINASFIPLGNWSSQPARWTLISAVLSADRDNSRERYTIKWGNDVGSNTRLKMAHTIDGSHVTVDNGLFSLGITPSGIKKVKSGGKVFETPFWRPALTYRDGKSLVPSDGVVTILYDSPVYKKFRFVSALDEGLELHQEFDVSAGSPFVRCSVRFINRTLQDIHLDDISPVEVYMPGAKHVQFGSGGDSILRAKRFSVHQRAFDCHCFLDGDLRNLTEDDNTAVWVEAGTDESPRIMFVFPFFLGMAAGEKELESVLSYDGESVTLKHYNHLTPEADVRLRETMARTFTHWLVIDPPQKNLAGIAAAAVSMPYVMYDRKYLTDMGVFQERGVSHLFDRETLEGALYFTRAQIPREEYPRSGRGTEPGDDGEGLYEVNLHAGGMMYGEVFQYFTPKPGKWHFDHYHGTLGIDANNIITGGKFSYRNGDILLALFQEYLRTGNRKIYELARNHSLLYADYAISHASGASEGIGHYYCDWYGNPYVYERFEGFCWITSLPVTAGFWKRHTSWRTSPFVHGQTVIRAMRVWTALSPACSHGRHILQR